MKTCNLTYGRGSLPVQLDPALAEWQVIAPQDEPALADPQTRFHEVCSAPTGTKALQELIKPGDRVAVVTADGTRPVPNRQLVPWLLAELPVDPSLVTVIIGTGSHRPNTPAEIEQMFGPEAVSAVRIINHNAFEPEANRSVGTTAAGAEVCLAREYVEADKRIALGFIEPHFVAGFSGGAKAVIPGIASIDTIFRIHRPQLIDDPQSMWGVVEGNPLRDELETMTALCPPDFMVNVTLNRAKEITEVFAGHYITAHRPGCTAVKAGAMLPVTAPFPVVVTSNSGYPLDQNLYQSVKGMSAAALIVEQGGTIILASECSDGIPDHGNFGRLMQTGSGPQDVIDHVYGLKGHLLDQWQAQILARILLKARVQVYSSMPGHDILACGAVPVKDLQQAVEAAVRKAGTRPRVAVLPDGPLTIPYVTA